MNRHDHSENRSPIKHPSKQTSTASKGRLRASAAAAGNMLLRVCQAVYEQTLDCDSRALNKRDVTILRFFVAMELIEADLWQQYDDLGGVTEGPQNPYQLALQFIDEGAPSYITNNALDEVRHSIYINSLLESEGAAPLDFDRFRVLRGSSSTIAQNVGRLTNLKHLDIDTTWYARYRHAEDPDGCSSLNVTRIANRPAIPRTDADLEDTSDIQSIANTAACHFGYVEYMISSLYATFSRKLKRAKVLKVALGIGGDEIAHFLEWVDIAGTALEGAPFKSNQMPSPLDRCESRSRSDKDDVAPIHRAGLGSSFSFNVFSELLSDVAALVPLETRFGGAVITVNSFAQNGLFVGQSPEFLRVLLQMAEDADTAIGS